MIAKFSGSAEPKTIPSSATLPDYNPCCAVAGGQGQQRCPRSCHVCLCPFQAGGDHTVWAWLGAYGPATELGVSKGHY